MYGIILVAVIAIIAGLLLSWASIQFAVPVDEKQAALLKWQTESVKNRKEMILQEKDTLIEHMEQRLMQMNDKMRMQSALLDAYSPLKVLARGYSVVSKDKIPVKDSVVLKKGDMVTIRLSSGSAEAEIMEVQHGTENEI